MRVQSRVERIQHPSSPLATLKPNQKRTKTRHSPKKSNLETCQGTIKYNPPGPGYRHARRTIALRTGPSFEFCVKYVNVWTQVNPQRLSHPSFKWVKEANKDTIGTHDIANSPPRRSAPSVLSNLGRGVPAGREAILFFSRGVNQSLWIYLNST